MPMDNFQLLEKLSSLKGKEASTPPCLRMVYRHKLFCAPLG